MRTIFIFLVVLLVRCDSSVQDLEFIGKYWIPKIIDWKSPKPGIPEIDKRKTEGFRVMYFVSNDLFYFLSSEQELLENDSIAYGVEPGFKVYKGNYLIKNNRMFVEYSQIYGSFFIDDKVVKDTITIIGGESPSLLINHKSFIKTDSYTKYSKQKIAGQIKIAENKKKKDEKEN